MQLASQTPIVPGEASTATFLGQDENGNITSINVKLPPGKAATLPDNMATTDMLSEFLSGTFALGPRDLSGLGVHWNGDGDSPMFVYGTYNRIYYSSLLGTNNEDLYLTDKGYNVPEMPVRRRTLIQSFTSVNVQDADRITFPKAFTADDVQILITAKTSTPSGTYTPPLCGYTSLDRNGFNLTRIFSDGTPKTTRGDLSIIAIGSVQ
ncbi:hypothetical protein GS501_04865 [Saccharibacter sp. 17.LH.SD]|uniref:hypothetical protein n=1 Tax=Saccharibacter sp. 17.LH.SD TaxID=2689393 RepID=UPI00136F4323|nr:hypothetical protein [Saccharibacter sp. 17.LH.SD]MXV44378.1 hypothetical protein [Saccharibacter sp. 17.LH.SD]